MISKFKKEISSSRQLPKITPFALVSLDTLMVALNVLGCSVRGFVILSSSLEVNVLPISDLPLTDVFAVATIVATEKTRTKASKIVRILLDFFMGSSPYIFKI